MRPFGAARAMAAVAARRLRSGRAAALLAGALALAGAACGASSRRAVDLAAAASPPCQSDRDCAAPASACVRAVCEGGRCAEVSAPAGTLPPDTDRADCQRPVCAEGGLLSSREDPGDAPLDDGNPCTLERCEEGAPRGRPAPPGEACGDGGVCARDGSCVRVVDLALGANHGCACFADGSVACWGTNLRGQVTGAPGPPVELPLKLGGIAGIGALSVARDFSCALERGGRVLCWGLQSEAGTPEPPLYGRFEAVAGLGESAQLASADFQSCAANAAGEVRCWREDADRRSVPVLVALPGRARQIAASGERACALLEGGKVMCWTAGETPSRSDFRARLFGRVEGASQLSLGGQLLCVVDRDRLARCWEESPSSVRTVAPDKRAVRGYFVYDTSLSTMAPSQLGDFGDLEATCASRSSACGLRRDGAVVCWGQPLAGSQYVDGAALSAQGLVRVLRGLGQVTMMRLSEEGACFRRRDGVVLCMGGSRTGALGAQASEGPHPPMPLVF